jgi:hypothetical protein
MAAVLVVFVVGISSSVRAKPAGNASTGDSRDGLPQPLDRGKDRGGHHDHHAGDARLQNVI